MEISMASDVTFQPSTTSPSNRPAYVTTTTAEDQVLDQFMQMRSMISSFLGAQQESATVILQLSLLYRNLRQSFCNYLYSVIEHLEEHDFLTFRNETVKLVSRIEYKAEEHKRQVTTTQHAQVQHKLFSQVK